MSETDGLAQLRAALEQLPDTAGVVIEDGRGSRFEIVKAYAIGTRIDDPGLVLRLREVPHPMWTGV